jgi:lipopolysaccharide/colanic/teichoic acid biosynthesis glycosyltransferase
LINVFKGDMSLVGPRPETPEWVEKYPNNTHEVLQIKPGITGPAQIFYRNEEKLINSNNFENQYSQIMQNKLTIDLKYVHEQSFITDIIILVRTIFVIFKNKKMQTL